MMLCTVPKIPGVPPDPSPEELLASSSPVSPTNSHQDRDGEDCAPMGMDLDALNLPLLAASSSGSSSGSGGLMRNGRRRRERPWNETATIKSFPLPSVFDLNDLRHMTVDEASGVMGLSFSDGCLWLLHYDGYIDGTSYLSRCEHWLRWAF